MFFLYLLIWVIFSMQAGIQVLLAGLAISAAVYWFACTHMRYKRDTDYKILRRLLFGIGYLFIVLRETAKSNLSVFRIVFSRRIKVEPHIVYFRTDLKTNAARVALANSITLAPGSVTVSLEDDLYCVHFLDGKFAEEIEDSVFVRQLRNIGKW